MTPERRSSDATKGTRIARWAERQGHDFKGWAKEAMSGDDGVASFFRIAFGIELGIFLPLVMVDVVGEAVVKVLLILRLVAGGAELDPKVVETINGIVIEMSPVSYNAFIWVLGVTAVCAVLHKLTEGSGSVLAMFASTLSGLPQAAGKVMAAATGGGQVTEVEMRSTTTAPAAVEPAPPQGQSRE